jgi:hypothetical protein
MENLAAQVFPQACRRNADTKHVKHYMWMWLRHSGAWRIKIHHSSFIIRHWGNSSFIIGVMPT